jgi:hypothetical protein
VAVFRFLFFAWIICFGVQSQAFDSPFYYGFQLGVDSSGVATENSLAANKNGLALGLLLEKNATNWLAFEVGALFVQKGYIFFANPIRDP